MAPHYTPLHSITLQYSTEHAITSHNIPLQYITLHYITGHYSTLHTIILYYITSHHITVPTTTAHCITLHFITLHHITLHYVTLHTTTLQYITYQYITHLHSYTLTYLHTYIPTCIRRDMHTHTHIACTKGGVKIYRQTDRQIDINTCMDDHGCMQALCNARTYTQGRIHRHMYIEHACQHGLDGIAGRLNGTDVPPLLIVL